MVSRIPCDEPAGRSRLPCEGAAMSRQRAGAAAAPGAVPDSVRQQALREGAARVIVALDVPIRAEGRLASAADAAASCRRKRERVNVGARWTNLSDLCRGLTLSPASPLPPLRARPSRAPSRQHTRPLPRLHKTPRRLDPVKAARDGEAHGRADWRRNGWPDAQSGVTSAKCDQGNEQQREKRDESREGWEKREGRREKREERRAQRGARREKI